jgi:hypothetical protein
MVFKQNLTCLEQTESYFSGASSASHIFMLWAELVLSEVEGSPDFLMNVGGERDRE